MAEAVRPVLLEDGRRLEVPATVGFDVVAGLEYFLVTGDDVVGGSVEDGVDVDHVLGPLGGVVPTQTPFRVHGRPGRGTAHLPARLTTMKMRTSATGR